MEVKIHDAVLPEVVQKISGGETGNFQKSFELDPRLFDDDKINRIKSRFHIYKEYDSFIEELNYDQLRNFLEALIRTAVAYYSEALNISANEKDIRNKFENLLDYKERTGCSESIEACLNEGCFQLDSRCAIRKIKEDILTVAQIFESRKNRSHIPHVAIELFFKKIIEKHNSIGLILSDKFGSPKVFTTDGSAISPIISEGIRRLSDAITEHEFRFAQFGEPFLAFNQRFPLDEELASKLEAVEKNPELTKYIKKVTFSSVGFEIAHEKMILSIIYLGDNVLTKYLKHVIGGIERIKIETDPEARIRSGFGKNAE
ncbi:hypothetical protein JNL27_00450 [bacterium]|nr:hypothetical protein [bacterium]